MNPGKLALVLVGPSARAEDTVVSDVIRTHTRSRNTCNVKIGRLSAVGGRIGPRQMRGQPLRLGSERALHASVVTWEMWD